MNVHPSLPLNDITEPYYKRREKSWRKFRRAKTPEQRIAARNEIGDVTSELLRLLRKNAHVKSATPL